MMPDLQTPAASPPLNARCRLPCADCPAFSHSLFADLPNESREKIDRFKITLRYEKGQNIHKEGNPSYGIHCIGSGIVKVYKTTGKQYIVRLAGRGSVLGLPTLVTGIPYLWTAEAVQSSTICFIPREVLLENIGKNPAMAIRIINILSHFLVESEQQRIELVRGTVRQRIARFLLFLSKNHGVREREGIAIRAGHHCCQPLMRKLKIGGTARASFYLYNTFEDVEAFGRGLRKVKDFFRVPAEAKHG